MDTKPHPNHHPLDSSAEWRQGVLFGNEIDEEAHLTHQYEYEILGGIEKRTEYVQYTERLIAEIIAERADVMMFLDKSARPIAWMVKALWPQLGIGDDGEPISMPEIRFANIDRERWEPIVGRSEDKDIGLALDRIPESTIDSLRELYANRSLSDHESAKDEPTQFDGKKVQIIDEVKSSGDTLVIAANLFSRAFPTAEIKTSYWMPPKVKTLKSGARINAEQPPWYKEDDPRGRLVADRNAKRSDQSSSTRQQRGGIFLSTRFPEVDKEGIQLKKEAQQLADEVADGIIPVTPGSERSEEALEAIMRNVNHLSTKEFITLKAAASNGKEDFQTLFVQYKLARARRSHPSQAS